MPAHSLITGAAKALVADLASDGLSLDTQFKIQLLGETPEHVLDLVDVIVGEGARKRPKRELIGALVFLLGHGLELLRYAVERNDTATVGLVGRLRDQLLDHGKAGRIRTETLQLILTQFAEAKLEMGDALRELMQRLVTEATMDSGDTDASLMRLAHELGNDSFAIHRFLDSNAEAMPEELRANVVMAVFAENEPAVREAALGFLLNNSSLARTRVAQLIGLAAPKGVVSPVMLRRMIAMRNWMPSADRSALDEAIQACRKQDITCASWPQPKTLDVLASGFDGSGAHTVLVVAKEAGKQAIAGLLVKEGMGVRDAWVRRGSKAETRALLDEVRGEIGLAPSSVDYAATVTRHFLAANIRSGIMPPFGLLDFAETVGLADLNPDALPADVLVATLCDAMEPALLSAAAVAETMRDSAGWVEEHPTVASWFEDDVGKLLGTKRAPRAKQMATLLAGPLQYRRHRWAEIAAWTALCLKHQPGNEDWQGFAIVARELLGQRPLDEIGIMHVIADTTLAVRGMQRQLGPAHAA